MSKLFVVFGATGAQGGSLIKAILNHPEFSRAYRLRAVTRNPDKPAARELKEQGVEVVEADLDKPESLGPAVQGAYAVFAVTNYWESMSAQIEIAQGKAIADASLAAGVSLFIWSSLPSVRKMSNGAVTEHHFDSKAEVEEYIRGLSFDNAVFYMPGWFMQNVWNPYAPQPRIMTDGRVVYPFAWPPAMQMPVVDIADTGKYLAPVLRDPARYHGKRLTCATAFYTAQEMIETWSRVSGRQVRLITEEEIPTVIDDPFHQKMARAMPLLTEYGYYGPTGPKDLEWTLAQMDEGKDGRLTSWEDFLVRHGPWFTTL